MLPPIYAPEHDVPRTRDVGGVRTSHGDDLAQRAGFVDVRRALSGFEELLQERQESHPTAHPVAVIVVPEQKTTTLDL